MSLLAKATLAGPGTTGTQGSTADATRREQHSLARSVYSTKKYRLPDEIDATFIKSLLLRIRTDLHAKGYLESPHGQLTRCAALARPLSHLLTRCIQLAQRSPGCAHLFSQLFGTPVLMSPLDQIGPTNRSTLGMPASCACLCTFTLQWL